MNGTCVDDQTVTLSPCHCGDDRVRLDRHGVGHVGDVALLHDHVGRASAASTSPLTIVEREASLPSRTTSSEAE